MKSYERKICEKNIRVAEIELAFETEWLLDMTESYQGYTHLTDEEKKEKCEAAAGMYNFYAKKLLDYKKELVAIKLKEKKERAERARQ